MIFRPRLPARAALLGAAAALGLIGPAAASGDGPGVRTPVLPKYEQECAACHLAYPPGLLPAASWQRLMSNLPRHFGADASLDAASVKELNDWLVANAGSYRKVQRERTSPPDRITRSWWFVGEHDEIARATWTLPDVRTPSNCAACHRRAGQGDFNDDDIRIPR